jgi:hypothetical protein
MQVSIPDSLKLFRTSHLVRGKCRVELWAKTGIVMSHQQRTTTVGSAVTVDQALWLQYEDGSEWCMDLVNTNMHLARLGHKITEIIGANLLDKEKFNAPVAFYNHTTDEFYFYRNIRGFRSQWRFILYKSPPLGVIGYWFRTLIFGLTIPQIFVIIVGLSPTSTVIGISLCASIPIFGILLHLTDRRYRIFEKHLEKIVEDFRNQLKES